MRCPIDNKIMILQFSEVVLEKYAVDYYRCPGCGLLQPENPTRWLSEAYSTAITSTDIGLVARNISNMRRLEPALYRLCEPDAKILDVGGGYGMLCRALRDRGFDCYTTDIYCENLFAKNYEPGPGSKANVLLAFEVFEHVADPVAFVEDNFRKYSPDLMIFSTQTYQTDEAPPRDWWYYALENGQHISLYHRNTIGALGKKLELHAASLSSELHVLSTRALTATDLLLLDSGRKLVSRSYGHAIRFLRRRKSFLAADYENAKMAARLASKAVKED